MAALVPHTDHELLVLLTADIRLLHARVAETVVHLAQLSGHVEDARLADARISTSLHDLQQLIDTFAKRLDSAAALADAANDTTALIVAQMRVYVRVVAILFTVVHLIGFPIVVEFLRRLFWPG